MIHLLISRNIKTQHQNGSAGFSFLALAADGVSGRDYGRPSFTAFLLSFASSPYKDSRIL